MQKIVCNQKYLTKLREILLFFSYVESFLYLQTHGISLILDVLDLLLWDALGADLAKELAVLKVIERAVLWVPIFAAFVASAEVLQALVAHGAVLVDQGDLEVGLLADDARADGCGVSLHSGPFFENVWGYVVIIFCFIGCNGYLVI